MAEFGRLDVWVNNVGGSDEKATQASLIDTTDEIFRSQLELNLTTAFQGAKAAAYACMEDGGVIINISSGAGMRGSPFTGPYAAAKAGMNNMTETLALELGAKDPGERNRSRPGRDRGIRRGTGHGRRAPAAGRAVHSAAAHWPARRHCCTAVVYFASPRRQLGHAASCCWSPVAAPIAR